MIFSRKSSKFLISLLDNFSFRMAQTFSIGLKSGEFGGHSIVFSPNNISIAALDSLDVWHAALSC